MPSSVASFMSLPTPSRSMDLNGSWSYIPLSTYPLISSAVSSLDRPKVICVRSLVPKEKNSASSAISSAVSAALGISIMVPTMYSSFLSAFSMHFSAVATTVALTFISSFFSPTRGIMISGTMSLPSSADASIAAVIIASVCISAISGYVTASLHPRCPSIGLNSFRLSASATSTSYGTPLDSASCCMSSLVLGRNSCSGGSSNLTVIGLSPTARYISLKSPFWKGNSLARATRLDFSSFAMIISRIAGILSSLKNMCSVRQRPTPSAPNTRACFRSLGVSALVLTFIVRISSAHDMILLKFPEISGGTSFSIPSYTLPLVPLRETNSPSLYFLPFTVITLASSSIATAEQPATQHLPIPRATTAAWDVTPP